MKKCTKCHQWKEEDEFPWKSKKKGYRHAVCKECTAKRSHKWYEENKDRQIETARANRETYRQQAQDYVWNYLSTHPCVDCGETDPMVLTFDHVRGKKRKSISVMVTRGWSLDTIIEEIGKCEVRCANCHMRAEKKRRGGRFWTIIIFLLLILLVSIWIYSGLS